MNCPRCHQSLIRQNHPPYLLWNCSRCGGSLAAIANLRKGLQHAFLQQAWNRTIGAQRKGSLGCLECTALMDRVPTTGPEIDLCRACQMIWLDAGELEQLPSRAAKEIAAEKWEEELRQMDRQRAEREWFITFLRRHAPRGLMWR